MAVTGEVHRAMGQNSLLQDERLKYVFSLQNTLLPSKQRGEKAERDQSMT